MKKLLILGILFIFASCSNYSTGYRTGEVVKFSNKGLIFKTWEGTLNLGGLRTQTDSHGNSNLVSNTWNFSIDNGHHRGEDIKSLSDSLNLALEQGYRVRLHYNQEFLTNWILQRGGTAYYVDKVEIIRN